MDSQPAKEWDEMSQQTQDKIAARCRSLATLRAAVTPTHSRRNLMPAILRGAALEQRDA